MLELPWEDWAHLASSGRNGNTRVRSSCHPQTPSRVPSANTHRTAGPSALPCHSSLCGCPKVLPWPWPHCMPRSSNADSCRTEVDPSGAVVEVQVQPFGFPGDPSCSPQSGSSLTAWDSNVLLLLVFQARSWESSRYKLRKLNCQELWGALSP